MTQCVAGDRLNLKARRHRKAQLEHPGAGDPGSEVYEQHTPVLPKRQPLVGRHANIRLNGRSLERQPGRAAGVPVGAAHGQSGELAPHRLSHRRREILEVDRCEAIHRGAVQLHFGAGGQSGKAQFARSAVHAEQAKRLLVRERPGRLLRTHPEIERLLLRRGKLDLQRAGLRVEPPRGDEFRGNIRHRDAGRHGEGHFAKLPLGQACLKVVYSRDNPGGRDEKLLELRIKNRFLDALVARLRFPVDACAWLGRQHQLDLVDRAGREGVLQRHRIERGDFQFPPAHLKRQPVHHCRLRRHAESPFPVDARHACFVLEPDVEHARLVGDELLRGRLAGGELCQLQLAALEVDTFQHGRR